MTGSFHRDIFQTVNLPLISWCKKRNVSNSTTHNQKAVIWLAGFTELFNWFLSLNSIDSLQFPMGKGWIFLLARQHQSVCSGGRKTPQQKKHHINLSSAGAMEAAMFKRSIDVLIYQISSASHGKRGLQWKLNARVIIEMQARKRKYW